MEEKITIDRETFKALAADTRIKILKILGKKRSTQSEIASELNLSIPTVKEHIDELKRVRLVKIADEGRKWKYIELTEKGRCVLDPERKKIWILLGLILLSITSGIIVFFGRFFIGREFVVQRMAAEKAVAVPEAAAEVAELPSKLPYVEIFIFIIVFILILILFIYLKRSYLGKYLKKK